MAEADSVSVFAEGTFVEQIQELVNYIVRNRSDDERAAFIRPFQDALKVEEGQKHTEKEDEDNRRHVFSMLMESVQGLGEGSEREIEGFFNLIYSHLFTLFPVDSAKTKQFTGHLLDAITSAPSESSSIKYRILSNLFNCIPRRSPLRLTVYTALLKLASSRDELHILQLSKSTIESWLSEWDITPEQQGEFLKTIIDAYSNAGEPTTSYEYSLVYLRTLPASSPAALSAAIETIATALRLPSVFDFDVLFKLDAVIAVKNHELFSLLHIFLTGGLPEYRAWEASHPDTFGKYNLDRTQLERKIRLLTLASLAFYHVGQDVPYSQLAEALQVETSEVERWVIDVIRVGLVSGKLSQTAQTLHITRSTARVFEREQWQALEKRLLAWKAGLIGILEIISHARNQGGAPAQVAV